MEVTDYSEKDDESCAASPCSFEESRGIPMPLYPDGCYSAMENNIANQSSTESDIVIMDNQSPEFLKCGYILNPGVSRLSYGGNLHRC